MDHNLNLGNAKFFIYVIGVAVIFCIIKLLDFVDKKKYKIPIVKNTKNAIIGKILIKPKSALDDD